MSFVDWSPDGKYIVASVWRRGLGWNLELFSLVDRTWYRLTDNNNQEGHPKFTFDGKEIVYSADYDGVFNIYRMNLETRRVIKLTNLLGGGFRPCLSPDGKILYFNGAVKDGFDIFKMKITGNEPIFQIPVIKERKPIETEPDLLPKEKYEIGSYSGWWKALYPRYWLPYFKYMPLNPTNGLYEFGLSVTGNDPLQRHVYALDAAFDFQNLWFTGRLTYMYDRWNPAFLGTISRYYTYTSGGSDNGDWARIRKNTAFNLDLVFPIITLDETLSFRLGLAYNSESDAKRSGSADKKTDLNDGIVGVAVYFSNAKKYRKAISKSDGISILITAENSDIFDIVASDLLNQDENDYTGTVYTLDYRAYLPMGLSQVLAIRLVVGWGTDKGRPYSLGGFASQSGSSFYGTGTIFNQRKYPLRGYDEGIEGLKGRRMGLWSMEWRFPIVTIERGATSPPAGIQKIYGKFFFDAGDAWNGDSFEEILRSVGAEFNFEVILGYRLSLNIRYGLYYALDSDTKANFYVTTGTSF